MILRPRARLPQWLLASSRTKRSSKIGARMAVLSLEIRPAVTRPANARFLPQFPRRCCFFQQPIVMKYIYIPKNRERGLAARGILPYSHRPGRDRVMAHEALRGRILSLVAEYHEQAHGAREFVPGVTKVNYAGRVYDAQEMMSAAEAVLDFQLTAGRYAGELERALKAHFKARRFLLVNSGSSANLLMVSTLCARTAPE